MHFSARVFEHLLNESMLKFLVDDLGLQGDYLTWKKGIFLVYVRLFD